MKRFNVRLFLVLSLAGIALALTAFGVWRLQRWRNSGSLVKLADTAVEEKRPLDAIVLLERYLSIRPDDDRAVAKLADLTLKRARVGELGRQDVGRVFNLAEAAIRRNPDNDELRGQVARFQMIVGQPGHAREHLEFLATKHPLPADATDDPSSAPTWDPENIGDPQVIQLMLVTALAGTGEFVQATDRATALVGFDRETREFDDARSRAAPADGFTTLAQLLEKIDDKEAAGVVIEQMIKIHGEKPDAWLALSNWRRGQNDQAAAREAVERALEIDPKNRQALFSLLDMLLSVRDMPRATEVAARCRELFPDDERGYRLQATIFFESKQYAEAEKLLREGLAAAPGRPTMLLMLAETCFLQQDLAGATAAIDSLREALDPNHPLLLLMEARLKISTRQWLAAKQLLEQARARFGDNPDMLQKVDFHLGQCYEQLGEHDAQLAANQRVLSQVPMAIEPRIGAAAAMAAAGRSAEALAEFESIAARVAPDRLSGIPQIWLPLLQLRMSAQRQLPVDKRDWSRIDGLIDMLQASPNVTPTQAAMLRSEVLVNKGEIPAAMETLERALTNDPGTAQLWMSLASLMLRSGGAVAARTVLDRVPEEIAGTAGMMLLEASVALAEGPEASDRSFRLIEDRAGQLSAEEGARVLTTLASMRRASGGLEEAERLWKLAVARTPDDLRLHVSRLEAALEAGDVARAEESLHEIERIGDDKAAQTMFARAAITVMKVRTALDKRQRDTERAAALSAEENEAIAAAQALLTEAENQRPGWNPIQVLFAEIAGLKNDLPAAIERLQRAMKLGSVSPRVVRHLVSLLYGLNRIDEAQQVLASLGSEGGAGFERLSAEMELRSGKLDEAVTLAERSVAANSRNPQELLWLGQLLDRAGRREQAGRTFEKAVEAGPDRVETWLTMLGHQLATGSGKAAEVTLDRAAAALGEPQRTACLAQGCEMLGRLPEAEQHYRAAVAAAPNDVEVKRNLAAFLLRRGQLTEAREPLQQIIDAAKEGQPTKIWARRTLAELLAERGNFRALQQAVALVGENRDVSGRLPPEDVSLQVKLLARRSEPVCWRQAIDLFDTISGQRPLTMLERLQMAELQEKTGRWEACRDGLISICSAAEVPPAILALLIEKLIAHDDISAARTWLRLLKKRLPESPSTHALEARIALARNDREAAVAAGRLLLASGELDSLPRDQAVGIAKLLEELGFAKAADRIISRLPEDGADAILVKVGFLGRQKQPAEALALLEKHWDSLSLERLMQAGFDVVRSQEDPGSHAARLDGWLTKARREDPGSAMLGLMLAELREIEGRPEEMEGIYREVLARKDVPAQLRAVVANNLAFHLASPATATEAQKLIDGAIEELGPQPDLLDTRGLVHLAAGDTARALEDLREATCEPTPAKLLHLAYAELEAGNTEAARQVFQQAKKKRLGSVRLSAADRQRLERLTAALESAAAA